MSRMFPDVDYDQSRTYAGDFADTFDALFPPRTGPALAEGLIAMTGAAPGDSALELGVGNGRVSVPLAAAGLRVTGVDSSEAMLERAAALAATQAVDLRLDIDDIRRLATAGSFDLVLCVGATIGMLTPQDQERVFEQVARVTAPGGRVVFEAHHVPRVRYFHRNGDATFRFPHDDGVILARSTYEPAGGEWWMRYSWTDPTPAAGERVVDAEEFSFTTDPAWQDECLRRSGLDLRARYGGWDRSPVSDESPTCISVYDRCGR